MQTELSQYAAVIGIDWADKKHDICVQNMAPECAYIEGQEIASPTKGRIYKRV